MPNNISIHNVSNQLIIHPNVRKWCKKPYGKYYLKSGEIRYKHPNGCPRYNNDPNCPEEAPLIQDVIDLNKELYFIAIKFNLKKHAERMKLLPRKDNRPWTNLQARCSRTWQNRINKLLTQACNQFCKNGQIFDLRPEGKGVYVIKTAKKIGIPIQTKPKDIIFKIALIGYPKNPKNTLITYL